jgi:chromosome segregation ATPase
MENEPPDEYGFTIGDIVSSLAAIHGTIRDIEQRDAQQNIDTRGVESRIDALKNGVSAVENAVNRLQDTQENSNRLLQEIQQSSTALPNLLIRLANELHGSMGASTVPQWIVIALLTVICWRVF